MRRIHFLATALTLCLALLMASGLAQEKEPQEDVLAQDLKLLQGKWELLHGRDAAGGPTMRSVKEIEGNRETMRRYDVQSGKLIREHTVEFVLSQKGEVRLFTFYAVGGDPKQGLSFIYKVNDESFFDACGLLQGEGYRNYQETPNVFRWKRLKPGAEPEPARPNPPEPLAEIDPVLMKALEDLGARVSAKANGYAIDIRRKPGFGDKEVTLVVQCPQIVDLTLEGVSITDQGLQPLGALKQLNRLILNDCSISAAGLKILAELPLRETLTSIGLRAAKIQDDDLALLKDFPKLDRLDVSQTAITDASLPALESLKLKYINVAGARLTSEGLEKLQKMKPKLLIGR